MPVRTVRRIPSGRVVASPLDSTANQQITMQCVPTAMAHPQPAYPRTGSHGLTAGSYAQGTDRPGPPSGRRGGVSAHPRFPSRLAAASPWPSSPGWFRGRTPRRRARRSRRTGRRRSADDRPERPGEQQIGGPQDDPVVGRVRLIEVTALTGEAAVGSHLRRLLLTEVWRDRCRGRPRRGGAHSADGVGRLASPHDTERQSAWPDIPASSRGPPCFKSSAHNE